MIESIPFFHSYDPVSEHLTLRGATKFPDEIFDFSQQIKILDLGAGALTQLPEKFPLLNKLKIVFLSRNPFESLPEVLGYCPQLRMLGMKSCQVARISEDALPENLEWLILTDNRLTELPESFGSLTRLRKCALAGNQLERIPESMVACQQLELLRLGANQLMIPPADWLFELPRLAWYCDSGNPFSRPFDYQRHLDEINPAQLTYGEQIGGSPTSTVFRGIDLITGEAVAIKHYASKLTSDGFSEDDIRAYAAAGEHSQLVRARGTIAVPGSELQGLVLDLIPDTFEPLAGPPDFTTCTRDVFDMSKRFSLPFITHVLNDIASALAHLHSRTLTHGDLYAHNILSDSTGASVLGDFGAASFFDGKKGIIQQQIEVRAFGYLIEDLLLRWDGVGDVSRCRSVLAECLNTRVRERPLMASVAEMLSGQAI